MSQTISDSILELVRNIAQGGQQQEALDQLLEHALPAIQEQIELFYQYAPKNPEFTPAIVKQFQDGLHALEESFQELLDLLDQASDQSWEEVGDQLQAAIYSIKKAQNMHQEQIEEGDTSHLFLNRLLLHLRAWQAGRTPGSMTTALVELIPHFEQDLRSFVAEFDDPVIHQKMSSHVDQLMETCHDVLQAIETGGNAPDELDNWILRIIQFSQDLDQTLSETAESHLAQGPTPFPLLNLVTIALDRYLNRSVSAQELADTMLQCQDWLHSQLPEDSDPALSQATAELFTLLQDMQQTALTDNTELLISQRESLLILADNLAQYTAVLSADEEVVNLVSKEGLSADPGSSEIPPMPALLATILQQAEAYLNGSSNSQELEKSVESLDRLIHSTEGQMSRSHDSQEIKQRTNQALDTLSEASQQLWDFVEHTDKEHFINIEKLLQEASQAVKSLSPRNRP